MVSLALFIIKMIENDRTPNEPKYKVAKNDMITISVAMAANT